MPFTAMSVLGDPEMGGGTVKAGGVLTAMTVTFRETILLKLLSAAPSLTWKEIARAAVDGFWLLSR